MSSMNKRDFMRQEFIGLEVEVVAPTIPGYGNFGQRGGRDQEHL